MTHLWITSVSVSNMHEDQAATATTKSEFFRALGAAESTLFMLKLQSY
jgi:hypothetical protein